MSLTLQTRPTALVQFGQGRAAITPPVGIYHPMWGAARHHRATGIHRPLLADILVFAAHDGTNRWAQAQIDMVGWGWTLIKAFVRPWLPVRGWRSNA